MLESLVKNDVQQPTEATSMRSCTRELLDIEDSTLVVIDVQESFLKKIGADAATELVDRIRWLVQVAHWLKVPVLVTAEDIPRNGPTIEPIRQITGGKELNKTVFGLADQENILAEFKSLGRSTAILVGLETDVCVQHSAMGLARLGYAVAVVTDATASPEGGHAFGLERMRSAGITLISCKGLFYEWMRDLERTYSFHETAVKPPKGLIL
jgi:nicotinamidase-related amidase